MVSGLLDTNKELEESIPIVSKEEKLTIESQVKEITEDQANDFNIQYDAQDSGSKELSEDEILATGYNIDLNELPEIIVFVRRPKRLTMVKSFFLALESRILVNNFGRRKSPFRFLCSESSCKPRWGSKRYR